MKKVEYGTKRERVFYGRFTYFYLLATDGLALGEVSQSNYKNNPGHV